MNRRGHCFTSAAELRGVNRKRLSRTDETIDFNEIQLTKSASRNALPGFIFYPHKGYKNISRRNPESTSGP